MKNLKISAKILILMSLSVLAVAVMAGLGLRQVSSFGREAINIAELNFPMLELQNDLIVNSLRRWIYLERAIDFGKQMQQDETQNEKYEQAVKDFRVYNKKLNHSMDLFDVLVEERLGNRVSMEELFSRFRTELGIIREKADLIDTRSERIFELLYEGELTGIEGLKAEIDLSLHGLTEVGMDGFLRVYSEFERLFVAIQDFNLFSIRQKERSTELGIRRIAIGSSLMLLASLVIGTLLIRSIKRSLSLAVDTANQISAGGRDIRIEDVRNDETGQLLTAMIEMSYSINRTETELSRHQNHLEELVIERTAELKKSEKAAESANQLKSEFLAGMSHEIRTPMNAIVGMTHLAMQTDLSVKQQNYVSKIQSSANTLMGIINDILDFSKIEAGKMDIESVRFNLENVLADLHDVVSLRVQTKSLELLFRIDPKVPLHLVGDPLRLGQVLINLTSNAIKFTDEGEIVVAVDSVSKNAERAVLRFSVTDTGIGIKQEQRSRIFEAFSQADGSTTRKYGGTGLGLAICKQIVSLMGGEISVESEYGTGSTFTFTAVFGHELGGGEKRYLPASKLKGMRVMVVDDNTTSLEILKNALESFSFNVTTVKSGEDALSELENDYEDRPYDLVLMDWKMPEMDGIETSRRIKNNDQLARIPQILMVTAYGREEAMHEAEEAGLDGFLVKPVSNSVLFNTIMEIFGERVAGESVSHEKVMIDDDDLKAIKRAKVLLVEDNEINQEVATEILQQAGVIVTVASNGHDAVRAVTESEFDLVLMDIQMPEMDGFEATRSIRTSGKVGIKDLPIIAMTAHALSGDREKSLEAGMNDHITKPVDPNELLSIMVKWIQRSPGRRVAGEMSEPAMASKAEIDAELPDALPGIDMEDGLRRVGGNKTLYKKLLIKFSANHGNAAEEIQSALDSGNRNKAKQLTHRLKGVAANIGAIELQANVEGLENSMDEDAERLMESFDRVSHSLKQMIVGIATLKQKADEEPNSTGSPVAPIDTAEVVPLLQELQLLLEEHDSQAVKNLVGLKVMLRESAAQEGLAVIEQYLERYDFDSALDELKELLNALEQGSSGE